MPAQCSSSGMSTTTQRCLSTVPPAARHQLVFSPWYSFNLPPSAAVLFALQASALSSPKQVFARVIMTNTKAHTQSTWELDITLAKAAGIDAFALNMGYTDPYVPTQLAHAFAAAEALGSAFKLFLTFDYTEGGKVWPSSGNISVISYLQQYGNSSAYYMYEDMPFVSAMEGLAEAFDYGQEEVIPNTIGPIYFAADWTSEGMESVFEDGPGLREGLNAFFSWDMWPFGAVNMTDAVDKAWISAISGNAAYMMGVSPWFFHSASGSKDWVWRGDDLWASRWAQTLDIKPNLVEIVSWNDYGVSNYIGPIHSNSEVPAGALIYVEDNP
ncbi:Mutanase [Hyphodiscus hymeniophilus]|uniref:Mutanase n=1 Tax=Hyphodiscus hymeniophilus TaxID=353542 RepID=A0A9P6VK79_9HELO|nr:Mutanase [Hyphodiscus hymeniophilus]